MAEGPDFSGWWGSNLSQAELAAAYRQLQLQVAEARLRTENIRIAEQFFAGPDAWPKALSPEDVEFLKVQKIDPETGPR